MGIQEDLKVFFTVVLILYFTAEIAGIHDPHYVLPQHYTTSFIQSYPFSNFTIQFILTVCCFTLTHQDMIERPDGSGTVVTKKIGRFCLD